MNRFRAAGRVGLHLEQLDEALAARQDAVALEQRLPLHRIETEVLRQRVDEVVVGNRRGEPRILPAALNGGDKDGLTQGYALE